MIINPYIFGGGVSYLVDDYSPAAAYSLRKISSTVTNAIRVRRDSDNAEQDIGFSGNDLDTTSLASFVGANSGYIVTWYNQGTGGATYDMTQATAGNQPRIVDTGTIETLNGKTAVRFQSASSNYLSVSIAETTENSEVFGIFSKVQNISVSGVFAFNGGATNKYRQIGNGGLVSGNIGAGVRNTTFYGAETSSTLNQQYLLSGTFTTTERKLYLDGSYITNNTNTSADFTTTHHYLGCVTASTGYLNGRIQEVIRFTSMQDSSRTDINTEINGYYGIY